MSGPAATSEISFEKYKVKKPADTDVSVSTPVIEANLLDFEDEPVVSPAITTTTFKNESQPEEWGDFSSAPSFPTTQSLSTSSPTTATYSSTTRKTPSRITDKNTSSSDFAFFPPAGKPDNSLKSQQVLDSFSNPDPLTKLVSLDVSALSVSGSNRKDAAGPSLNQIQAAQIDSLSRDIWNGK